GVTQGIFPEGGLSRDGALRQPKVGLLDALLQLTAEPGFGRELYFVPVGINYDRVLEDEALLAELRGRDRPPSTAEKVAGALKLLWVVPTRVLINLARAATGRLRLHGYVAVAFGEPVRWSEMARERRITIAELGDEERRATAKVIAAELMRRIALAIPATPVPLVARAVLELGGEARESDLASRVRDLRARLEALGVPVALGLEFDPQRRAHAQLDEDDQRNRDLARLDADLLALEEAESILRLGVERLARRKVLRREGERIRVAGGERASDLVRYYARSLAALDQIEPGAAEADRAGSRLGASRGFQGLAP
ncbi:MAG TPA: hypothetical protein VN878_02785, partial [Usitatibacter sp.]|nr:hypothetical protein [Usitatibacter sp.]